MTRVHSNHHLIADFKLNACSVLLYFGGHRSQGYARGPAALPKIRQQLALVVTRLSSCGAGTPARVSVAISLPWAAAPMSKECLAHLQTKTQPEGIPHIRPAGFDALNLSVYTNRT